MHRSYVSKEWIDSFINNNNHPLPAEVVSRFISVLRIKADEPVAVFDGHGRQVVGFLINNKHQIIFAEPKIEVLSPNKSKIILVQAAIEESKMAETIRRGCEYGVDEFIIYNASRSEKYCYNKLLAKKERLMRLSQDACRQSERFFIPEIHFIESITTILKTQQTGDLGVYGDARENKRLSSILREHGALQGDFYIVVGPEGGLTEDEALHLSKAGFIGVIWAPFILRSELAALAAIAIVHAFGGRA